MRDCKSVNQSVIIFVSKILIRSWHETWQNPQFWGGFKNLSLPPPLIMDINSNKSTSTATSKVVF